MTNSGASSINSPVPPKLDLADVHSQLYQTPSTTSASSSLYRTISTSTRKRSRLDELEKPRPLYDFSADDCDDNLCLGRRNNDAEMDYDTPNCRGQMPLITPIEASVGSMTPSEHTGNNRKRSRCDEAGVMDERNRIPPPASPSWGQSVMYAVGKVWNICWSGAFSGFYAGGGHGYRMSVGSVPQLDDKNSSSRQSTSTEKLSTTPTREATSGYSFDHHKSTPVPGQYPDDSEIQQNWVVIPTDGPADCFSFGAEASNPLPPAKRVHRMSDASGLSHTRYRPSAVPRGGKKVSPSGPSTPTRIPILSPGSKNSRESPASVETQRYAAQKRCMEREEDASLRRLNRQLQMMIKEGKQALGKQVEVDDLDMDQYQ